MELLFEYIHDVVLPKLCKEETIAVPTDVAYSSDFTVLLGKYGLRTTSHASLEQFVTRYLTYECRAHRWIQLNVNESITLENKGLVPKNSGYQYKSENGNEMAEYHVDACKEFQEKMNKETNFGGKLSVRLHEQERLLLMFAHDEVVFKQYLLTKKAWSGPNGETVLVPKDDGQGVMISAFQSRELGFGMELTKIS